MAAHLFTALLLALPSVTPATAAATAPDIPPGDYQQVQLATGPPEIGEAMSLAVLPDRGVLHTARDGTVRHTDPAGNTKVAGKLDVYTHDEEGLQGIAADPAFATNRARVSAGAPGGTIEVRAGSATGTLLGTLTVRNTGGWDTFANVSANLSDTPSGTTTLFLLFKGMTGQGNLLDVDTFTLTR
ncbi:carbohydrate-binding protein [Nonomuraea sp. K274]|uniref:Carbohydrate-binding protein n=1 Tax=Nonomuraea cypriaca TaxID=1187855 RepID=A0A931A3Q0_9ACTN|nr:carbohydrate-binding protein [Nonomuraea cypriaca]MBF8184528.1 carbohydrate-binding protein [Nonomuraea cypriaca]